MAGYDFALKQQEGKRKRSERFKRIKKEILSQDVHLCP